MSITINLEDIIVGLTDLHKAMFNALGKTLIIKNAEPLRYYYDRGYYTLTNGAFLQTQVLTPHALLQNVIIWSKKRPRAPEWPVFYDSRDISPYAECYSAIITFVMDHTDNIKIILQK